GQAPQWLTGRRSATVHAAATRRDRAGKRNRRRARAHSRMICDDSALPSSHRQTSHTRGVYLRPVLGQPRCSRAQYEVSYPCSSVSIRGQYVFVFCDLHKFLLWPRMDSQHMSLGPRQGTSLYVTLQNCNEVSFRPRRGGLRTTLLTGYAFFGGLLSYLAGALACILAGRWPRWARLLCCGFAVAGGLLEIGASCASIITGT